MSGAALLISNAISPCIRGGVGSVHILNGIICCHDSAHARKGIRELDASDQYLLPGFIDQHVHGAGGQDFISAGSSTPEVMLERWLRVGQALGRHGVSAYQVTLHATSVENVRSALYAGELAKSHRESSVVGINLEGPYLNPAAAGAHQQCFLRTPEELPLKELIGGTGGELPRMITVAPELPGGIELIRDCTNLGITCSIGHTLADSDVIAAAVDAGARCATHYGNAMGIFHQRAPGAIGALPVAESVMLEIVANEALLHPVVWSLVRAAAGPQRIILTSDSMPSAGSGTDLRSYEFSGTEVMDDGDGVVIRRADGRVWGNARPLWRLAAAYAEQTRCSLEEIWQCTSKNAAQLLGADDFGDLRRGQKGSVVLLDRELQLRASVINGAVVYATGQ